MSKDKNKLKAMLEKRNPLSPTKRVAVKPLDLYTKPQVGKTTKPQIGKTTSRQVVKKTKPQVVKYTTHLEPEVIKAIKIYAAQREVKDYLVVKEAIENFLKRVKK